MRNQIARVKRMRAFHPDVALDFYFGSRTPWVAWLSGASRRIGPARSAIARRLLTDPLSLPLPADEHMLERYGALVRPLGVRDLRREWEFPIHAKVRARMRERVGPLQPDDIVFVVGAGDESKRLAEDRTREFLEELIEQTGRRVLLVEDRREPALGAELTRIGGVHALPGLALPELGALFNEVALVVVPDTGPLHIALGTAPRVLTWYQSTDPLVHRSDRPGSESLYREVCEWQPCDTQMKHRCQLECTRSIEVDELVEAARKLLSGPAWEAPDLPARDPETVL
jgi:ADP-heptose:LPS heptosyltransferase